MGCLGGQKVHSACRNMVVERRSGDKVSEKKLKFKAWCQAKNTTEEKAFLKEYVKAKRIEKREVAQAHQAE